MMSERGGNWWRRFECYIMPAQKNSGVQISLKKWSARVTDEFSSETLILRKRLSSLYMKCVQFWSEWRPTGENRHGGLRGRPSEWRAWGRKHVKIYIKIHWLSMIFLCTIWIVNMSPQRFRNWWRLILRPQILHIEFSEDQVVVIVWEVTYLRW